MAVQAPDVDQAPPGVHMAMYIREFENAFIEIPIPLGHYIQARRAVSRFGVTARHRSFRWEASVRCPDRAWEED